jgi:hypothetical protein
VLVKCDIDRWRETEAVHKPTEDESPPDGAERLVEASITA